jgi:hypothetical protein
MTAAARLSSKSIQLMVTCLCDAFCPQLAKATVVDILNKGVHGPGVQVCCLV